MPYIFLAYEEPDVVTFKAVIPIDTVQNYAADLLLIIRVIFKLYHVSLYLFYNVVHFDIAKNFSDILEFHTKSNVDTIKAYYTFHKHLCTAEQSKSGKTNYDSRCTCQPNILHHE